MTVTGLDGRSQGFDADMDRDVDGLIHGWMSMRGAQMSAAFSLAQAKNLRRELDAAIDHVEREIGMGVAREFDAALGEERR